MKAVLKQTPLLYSTEMICCRVTGKVSEVGNRFFAIPTTALPLLAVSVRVAKTKPSPVNKSHTIIIMEIIVTITSTTKLIKSS